MKFFNSALLALCIASGASAFAPVAPQGKASSSSALFSQSSMNPPATGYGGAQNPVNVPQAGAMTTKQAPPTSGGLTEKGHPHFKEIWDTLSPIQIQGGKVLRTWSLPFATEYAQVLIKTDDRSLHCDLQLWEGPDNIPQKMNVYVGYGRKRPIRALISTPESNSAIALRNIGPLEYPVSAGLGVDTDGSAGLGNLVETMKNNEDTRIIQGGSVQNFPIPYSVSSMAILLGSDGRPVNAKVELLQGPNSVKLSIEHYAEDGALRPLFLVIQTPGADNVIRVMNTAPSEFPLSAAVQPFRFGDDEWTTYGL